MVCGKMLLQILVLLKQVPVVAQRITKGEALPPQGAGGLGEVEVVGPLPPLLDGHVRSEEVERLMGPMLCPRIAQVVQRSLRSARLPESATPASMSVIGLAARPGIDVDPMCSTPPRNHGCRPARSTSRSSSKAVTQAGSYGTSTTRSWTTCRPYSAAATTGGASPGPPRRLLDCIPARRRPRGGPCREAVRVARRLCLGNVSIVNAPMPRQPLASTTDPTVHHPAQGGDTVRAPDCQLQPLVLPQLSHT